jgi:hypothetical protein
MYLWEAAVADTLLLMALWASPRKVDKRKTLVHNMEEELDDA